MWLLCSNSALPWTTKYCKMASGHGYWLSLESWGLFFWIYVLNCWISFLDSWNISFVILLNFDIYGNFVYHYHDNLLCQLTHGKWLIQRMRFYLKLMINVLNLSLTLAELKQQLKIEAAEAFKNELKKKEELESTVSVLQQHVKICQNQMRSWNSMVEGYVFQQLIMKPWMKCLIRWSP